MGNTKKKSITLEPIPQSEDIYADWTNSDDVIHHLEKVYRTYVLKKIMFITVCIVVATVSTFVAVTIGQYDIGFVEAYNIIINHIMGNTPDNPLDYYKDHVVWNLRLPRVLIALIAGAGLAVSGTVMQCVLKNPMADPYTAGISSGAAFGATLAMGFGLTVVGGDLALIINAFLFALVPTAVIVAISSYKKVSPTSMILAGIAVMYIFNACTTALKLMMDSEDLASLYRWQVGTLEGLGWGDVLPMFCVTLGGSIMMLALSSKINILGMGEDGAKSLGLNTSQLRIFCLVVVSLIAASVVSYTGIIGFIGLVAPHIVRLFIGSDNKYLIPASALFGGTLLLVADVIGKVIIQPATLQVGVVTAFIGGPLFLYLIIRSKKEAW